GPGTGKTQIIAARIAKIIQMGSQPENILCLTYTDAGTIAMRERLLSFIGATAYRVEILTFHAFCNMVIQANPASFGYGDLQPVSELEKRAFVKEVLDGLPHDNPLARVSGDLYGDAANLLQLYATMKKEDWRAETIIAAVDAHLEELPNDPSMRYSRKYTDKKSGTVHQPGDLKVDAYEAKKKSYNRLKAAVNSFATYQQVLLDQRRYDFDDMILWVIAAFRESPELLLDYQERYHYVLVDEYQDTSGAQNEIVDLLMEYWDDPNLFVVGDDDQSIYRFQGANIENILSFHGRYAPDVVPLTENYRSSQQILDAAGALIGLNSQRLAGVAGLGGEKRLRANRPDGGRPEVRVYPTLLQEALGVACEIGERYARGEDLSRVAVLYRNHRQVEPLVAYFTAKNIPFSIRRREDVLRTPLVRQLVAICRYLQGESVRPHSGERLLFDILHFPTLGLVPLEVARLYALRKGGDPEAPVLPVRELLRRHDAFAPVSELIEALLAAMAGMTLQELVQAVINRFGLLADAESAAATVWNLEVLNTFFDFVKDETARSPRLTLDQFITMLELMESQQIQLPAERVACNSNGVNLITCHSSKGLEFRAVYLLGCVESEWEKKRTPPSFTMPPTMLHLQRTAEENAVEELRRLFYVAMTRAEENLVVSYASRDNGDKPLAKSRFVAELEQSGLVEMSSRQFEAAELEEAMTQLLREPAADAGSIFTSDFVGELLRDYKLSVTHLNGYLKCPRSFFYTRVLRVPEPRNGATAFGSSVHESLEYLFTSMLKFPGQLFPPKADFIRMFTREMQKRQDSFTEVEFTRRLHKGTATLEALYDRFVDNWHKDVLLEKNFTATLADGVRINGLVDKLEKLTGNLVNLVDYKTGKHDRKKFQPPDPARVVKALEAGKEPAFEDLHGGNYWRQAVFYKIMVESASEQKFAVSSTEFFFVEPDERSGDFVTERVEIEPEHEDLVREQISSVYHRIMNREFDQGCHDKYCDWCRVKS
ncbi:MAG TPA: ATP-dependent DNA helicase, partial [Geobacteraceae bacterium]|nr:ATP-dependent DNA helicase [Geobacteraceae bacterium]